MSARDLIMRWRNKSPQWVVGHIDSNGAIHAITAENNVTHPNYYATRKFRWSVGLQKFSDTLHGCSKEETEAVWEWLKRHGHADEERHEYWFF